ncbi:MAG: hypothetical protein MZV64_29615 [Ignavibacteriales bacterium]|nr:hypothetical protein [Ignavibacteriales bacterium]
MPGVRHRVGQRESHPAWPRIRPEVSLPSPILGVLARFAVTTAPTSCRSDRGGHTRTAR